MNSPLRVHTDSEQPKVVYQMTRELIDQMLSEDRKIHREEIQKLLRLETEKPMGPAEARAFLSGGGTPLSANTFWKRVREGKIPWHKEDGSWYFYASEMNQRIKSPKK